MLKLEKVNGENVWNILKLSVSNSQREYVASNDVSIIEAYTTITANGYAFPFIKTYPCGKAEYCWLSYEPENTVAKRLYESFGFVETGDMDGEETIAVLRLP